MNSLGRLMGRGFLRKTVEPFSKNRRRISFTSFSAFKFSPYLQQASPWTGQSWNISIPTGPTPKHSSLKVNPGESLMNIGSFDILDSQSTMSAALTNAFNGINECPDSKYNEVKAEVKEGLGSHPLIQKTKVKKQRRKKLQKKLIKVRKGDKINLYDLLFTKRRDYLVKNDNRQVKAEQLAGKVIIVYFVPLPHDFLNDERMVTTYLIDIYNHVPPNKGFEVVLVTYELPDDSQDVNPKKEFKDLFSRTPWAAIPFSDTIARSRLRKRFGVSPRMVLPTTFVIDSTGKVLQTSNCDIFDKYGGLGYPFSDAKIKYLESRDDKAAKQLSLTTLIASPERDYVISNNGDKVPIHTLEEKVVALYFYEDDGDGDGDLFTTKLKMTYEELSRKKENFEVVLIYVYDTEGTCECTSEESFWKSFKTMPWLALPFKDPNYRKLKRFFSYPYDKDSPGGIPTLVTIGPHGEFIEPWSADVLTTSKVATALKVAAYSDAYPFTREKLAKLETKKIKELKLEMLWDSKTVFKGKNGTEVQLSQLAGKRIILYFANEKFSSEDIKVVYFLKTLKEKYVEMKGTNNEFEVIYISYDKHEFSYEDHVGDVSWLVAHTTELLPGDYSLYCCSWLLGASHSSLQYLPGQCHGFSSFLAFDQDGMLVRKSLIYDPVPTLSDKKFPFYNGGMEKEAFFQQNDLADWNIWDYYYSGVQINSFIKYDKLRRE